MPLSMYREYETGASSLLVSLKNWTWWENSLKRNKFFQPAPLKLPYMIVVSCIQTQSMKMMII